MDRLLNQFLLVLTIIAFFGCEMETETSSPNPEQVAYARQFLYINPELNIEPLGYVEKKGFDYHVRLKFIAKTDDPSFIFDNTEVNSAEFKRNFKLPLPEATIDEPWWDVYDQAVTGGNFCVPKSEEQFWRLSIGYLKNEDNTLTVYAWRHEYGHCQ